MRLLGGSEFNFFSFELERERVPDVMAVEFEGLLGGWNDLIGLG
jgi:hypothetical protein